jgi:hypothetical protein
LVEAAVLAYMKKAAWKAAFFYADARIGYADH